ncbi:hypothetical protein D3C72_748060 [compost metagenome]
MLGNISILIFYIRICGNLARVRNNGFSYRQVSRVEESDVVDVFLIVHKTTIDGTIAAYVFKALDPAPIRILCIEASVEE